MRAMERDMKTFNWIIPLIFVASIPLSSQAASKNLCDEYFEAGMDLQIIERCQAQHGVSEWFQQEQESRARAQAEENERKEQARAAQQAQENRLRELREAIQEQTFDRNDLREELGFGMLDIVAYQTVVKYGHNYAVTSQDRELITTADRLCRELGFDVAKRAVVDPLEIDGQELSGKAHYFGTERSGSFLNRQKNEVTRAWRWSHTRNEARIAQLYDSVTCVKSEIEDNELMEEISFIESVLAKPFETQVGENKNQQDIRISDRSRNFHEHRPSTVRSQLYFHFETSGGSAVRR